VAGRIVGRQPKPRALIQGFDDEVAQQLVGLFPTARRIDWLGEVAQREWDVLITTKTVHDAKPHLWVVAIGCTRKSWPGDPPVTLGQCQFSGRKLEECPPIMWRGSFKAGEFVVPDNLPAPIKRLVDATLLPAMREHEDHQVLWPIDINFLLEWRSVVLPFLLLTTGNCVAGRFPRAGGPTECWCLPGYMEDMTPQWVKVALGEWYKRDPQTFPSAAWVDAPQWRTSDENRLAGQLEELRSKRAEMLASMESAEEALLTKLGEAKQTAEARERTLLKGTGEGLEAIVAECLTDLGFNVQDMDQVYPLGKRREDLQVRDPATPDWVALVEVKGYATGAKVNDLLRFGRFRTRYVQDHGEDAAAVWYMVNQFNEDDPGVRPPVLASNEAELETFAADGGLAIDTADLFQLWMAVREGSVTATQARAALVRATGRFVFSLEASSEAQQSG
jgi:hypothetical protein